MRHWYGVITDENNRYVANAAIKVYTAGAVETGTLAAGDLAVTGSFEEIYSDDGLTPIDQQGGDFLWTDSVGWAEFWADSATVVMALVFDGDVKRVITDVELDGSGGGGGTVIGGPITSGDLTMSSGVILGRTSVGTGAIQELTPSGLFGISGGNATVSAASASDVNTGTATGSAVTPDALAESNFGIKTIEVLLSDPTGSAVTAGDGKAFVRITSDLNGMNLIGCGAVLDTAGTGGGYLMQLRRKRSASDVDMLSTRISIDSGENDSADAATPPAINTSNDDVATGDRIYFDRDGVPTGGKGDLVWMQFQLP